MLTRPQLLMLATRYAGAARCSLYTVGRRAVGSNTLFLRMQAGGDCRSVTAERATRWLLINWPRDEPWPPALPPRRVLLEQHRMAESCPELSEGLEL